MVAVNPCQTLADGITRLRPQTIAGKAHADGRSGAAGKTDLRECAQVVWHSCNAEGRVPPLTDAGVVVWIGVPVNTHGEVVEQGRTHGVVMVEAPGLARHRLELKPFQNIGLGGKAADGICAVAPAAIVDEAGTPLILVCERDLLLVGDTVVKLRQRGEGVEVGKGPSVVVPVIGFASKVRGRQQRRDLCRDRAELRGWDDVAGKLSTNKTAIAVRPRGPRVVDGNLRARCAHEGAEIARPKRHRRNGLKASSTARAGFEDALAKEKKSLIAAIVNRSEERRVG